MPSDPYYKSEHWCRLRVAALQRDNSTCFVPGCGQRAIAVDHIERRRGGGADVLANVRSPCREHDQQVKERPDGSH
jgi:hypothetical protein